jgi:hypothetical protein
MRIIALLAFLLLTSGCSTAHAAAPASRSASPSKAVKTHAVKTFTRDAPRFAFGAIIVASAVALLIRRRPTDA